MSVEATKGAGRGGVRTHQDQHVPRAVPLPARALRVVSSNFSVVVECEDGALWGLGLGEGDRNVISSPVPIALPPFDNTVAAAPQSHEEEQDDLVHTNADPALARVNESLPVMSSSSSASSAVSSDPYCLPADGYLRKGYHRVFLSAGAAAGAQELFEVVLSQGQGFLLPSQLRTFLPPSVQSKDVLDCSVGWKHELVVLK
eukprot:gene30976-37439_t